MVRKLILFKELIDSFKIDLIKLYESTLNNWKCLYIPRKLDENVYRHYLMNDMRYEVW